MTDPGPEPTDSSNPIKPQEDLEGELFAAIDLGSNSFHLVVARYEHGTLHVIDRIKEMVRLAEGVNAEGTLAPEVAQRALTCLERFGQRLEGIADDRIVAVGTNATRRMKDGWKFLAQAEKQLGHSIEIISGEEEARTIYLGVAHGVSEKGQRLVMDIGGGSTEFIIGREFNAIMVESLFFGCVALAQKFFPGGKISRKRWRRAHGAVSVELQRIAADFKALGWEEALGSSGTMRAVRNVVVNNGWSERGITPSAMLRLREEILQAGHEQQLVFDGLSDRRRPVFASGAVIVDACLETLGIEQIEVTDYALREGLLYDLIGRILHADPREGAIQALMRKYHIEVEQARRVSKTARKLVDAVRKSWGLPKQLARNWLAWSSQLHEIGLTIAHHGYHRHGAYLLRNSDLPGFSRQDQLVVATLVLNHRRKPDAESFDKLQDRLRPWVIRCAVILRLAALLHRTRCAESVPAIKAEASGNAISLTFPEGWLEQQPLTAVDLENEARQTQRIGITLEFS